MVYAEVIEDERPDDDGGPAPRHSLDPEEVLEQVPDQPEENPGKSLGKGIPRHPKILRMMLLSLTSRCFKASGQ